MELYPSRRDALGSEIFEACPFVQGRSQLHKVKTARMEIKDDCSGKCDQVRVTAGTSVEKVVFSEAATSSTFHTGEFS